MDEVEIRPYDRKRAVYLKPKTVEYLKRNILSKLSDINDAKRFVANHDDCMVEILWDELSPREYKDKSRVYWLTIDSGKKQRCNIETFIEYEEGEITEYVGSFRISSKPTATPSDTVAQCKAGGER